MKKRIAIYPGTFDPVTFGHIDIIKKAKDLFDEVIVTVAENPSKTPLFSLEERLHLLNKSLEHYDNVSVDSFSGLTVDFARLKSAITIIRGLRAVSDFEYEFQMALMNKKIAAEITTVFLLPHEKFIYVNSSIIKNLASLRSDVSDFVPECVKDALVKKYKI